MEKRSVRAKGGKYSQVVSHLATTLASRPKIRVEKVVAASETPREVLADCCLPSFLDISDEIPLQQLPKTSVSTAISLTQLAKTADLRSQLAQTGRRISQVEHRYQDIEIPPKPVRPIPKPRVVPAARRRAPTKPRRPCVQVSKEPQECVSKVLTDVVEGAMEQADGEVRQEPVHFQERSRTERVASLRQEIHDRKKERRRNQENRRPIETKLSQSSSSDIDVSTLPLSQRPRTKTAISLRSRASSRASGCPLDAYLPPDLGATPLLVLSPSAAQCLITTPDGDADGPSVATTRRLLAEARAVMARLNTDHVDVELPKRRTSQSPTRGVSLDVQLSCSPDRHQDKAHRPRPTVDFPSQRRVSQSRGRMDLPTGDKNARVGVDHTPVLQAFASKSAEPVKPRHEARLHVEQKQNQPKENKVIPPVLEARAFAEKRPSISCPLHPSPPHIDDCLRSTDPPNAAVHTVCRSPDDGVRPNATLLEAVCPREDSNVSVLEVVRPPDECEVRERRMTSQRLPSLSIRRGCSVQVGPSFHLDSIEFPVSNMSVLSVARLEASDVPSKTKATTAGLPTEAVTRAVEVLTERLARLEDRGLASAERVEGLLGRLTDGVGKLAEVGVAKVDVEEDERRQSAAKNWCRETHKASPPPRRPRRPLGVSTPSYINIPPKLTTTASAQCSPEPPEPAPAPALAVETLEELAGRVHALSSQFRRLSEAVAPSATLRLPTSTETIPSSDTRLSTDLSGPSNSSLPGLRLPGKPSPTEVLPSNDLSRVSEESMRALKLASLTEPVASHRDIHFQDAVGQTEIIEVETDESSDGSNQIANPLISPVPSQIRSPPHPSPRRSSLKTPTVSPLKIPVVSDVLSPKCSPTISPTKSPIGIKPREPVGKYQTLPQPLGRQLPGQQPIGKQQISRGVILRPRGRATSVLGLGGTTSPTRQTADLARNIPVLVSRSPARTSIVSSKSPSSQTGHSAQSKTRASNRVSQSDDSSHDSNARSSGLGQSNLPPRERRRMSREGTLGRRSSSPSDAGTSVSSLSEGEVRSLGEVRTRRSQNSLSEGQLLSLGEVPTCESSSTSERHSLRQTEDVYSIPKMLLLEMQMDHEQALSRFSDLLK